MKRAHSVGPINRQKSLEIGAGSAPVGVRLARRTAPDAAAVAASRPALKALPGLDGRTRGAKRYRALLAEYLELTGGKYSDLVRSLVALVMQREVMEARIASGELLDALDVVRVANSIARLMVKLGLAPCNEDAPDATAEVIAHIRAATEAA